MPKTKRSQRVRQANNPPQSGEAQDNFNKNNRKGCQPDRTPKIIHP